MQFEENYNERLFGSYIKRKIHYGRFYWLNEQLEKLNCHGQKMLELGCYDAKTLEMLSHKPSLYRGYDANWENGLDIGRKKWEGHKNIELVEVHSAKDMEVQEKYYDISTALETFEHVPSVELEPYVKKLAFATKKYCFITVPNEQGIFFFFKHFVKKVTNNQQEDYTFKEFLNASLGNIEKVERNECGHKGFNWGNLIKVCQENFDKVDVVGLPFKFLPLSANFAVAITGVNNH